MSHSRRARHERAGKVLGGTALAVLARMRKIILALAFSIVGCGHAATPADSGVRCGPPSNSTCIDFKNGTPCCYEGTCKWAIDTVDAGAGSADCVCGSDGRQTCTVVGG